MLSGSSVRSLVHYAARVRPSGGGWYASVGSFFGRSAGAVYRTCQSSARGELYGYGRYGSGGGADKFVRAFARAVAMSGGMPTWAPEAKNNASSSAAPQRGQQPQQGGGAADKTNASGANKTSPEEQENKNNKKEHDKLVASYKEYRKIEGKDSAKEDGGAVGALKSKGYAPAEARKIVAMLNKMKGLDFDGDPIKARSAYENYKQDINRVPARKNGKGEMRSHAEWAAEYAEWLGGLKGVNPPKAAQIPISNIKGVTGTGRRRKVRKNDAKHALLKPIGLKEIKGGKVYDAFKVTRSTGSNVPGDATLLRDGEKWYILKEDGSLERIRRGRGRDPVFDERGILILDPRYKEVELVPIKGKDAEDINGMVEDWIGRNPHVKTKQKTADKRAEHVKKALDKKFKGKFGPSVVSVKATGKNIEISIEGDGDKLGARAKAVAAFMESDSNKSHFQSVFADLANGATITVQSGKKINAGQNGTFRSVVGAIKKLQTKAAVPAVDVRKFGRRGTDVKPDTRYVERRLKAQLLDPAHVTGKKVAVKVRYAKGFKPDEKAIKEFVEKRYKKDGRDVKVTFVEVDVKPLVYDAAQVTDLGKRLKAALWDGNPRTRDKADKKANIMLKNAQTGGGYRRASKRRLLLPIKADVLKKMINADFKKHADKMRTKVIAAKGSSSEAQAMKEYKAWWAVAKDFLAKRADYYKPEAVENEHPRTPSVGRGRRGGGRRRSPRPRRRRRRRI